MIYIYIYIYMETCLASKDIDLKLRSIGARVAKEILSLLFIKKNNKK